MRSYKVRDLLKIRNGKDHKELKEGNIPVFGSGGIMRFGDRYLYNKESILLPRKGTLSNIQWVDEPFWTVDTLYYTEINESLVDGYFLYSYLTNLDLSKLNSGTGVPSMTFDSYYDIEVFLPELSAQKQVSNVLKEVKEKIDLNNRINAELEAMAKTLYDYWFVQFDFPDKNNKPYKTSGGKLVWNEELKREIPEGWEVIKVDKLLAKGDVQIKVPSSEYGSFGEIPIIDQSTDFIAGYTNNIKAIINGSKIPRIIFGDHTRILKLINFDFVRGADGTQVLLSNNPRIPQYVFYHSLLKIDLSNYGYARHFKFLKDNLVILPNIIVANEYEEMCSSFFSLIKENIFQNIKLAELRDWLLPMLMNGQVKVK